MGIKRYSVSLEESIVDKAQQYCKDDARKLSPVINNLLERWTEKQNEIKDAKEKKKERIKRRKLRRENNKIKFEESEMEEEVNDEEYEDEEFEVEEDED